MSLIVTSVSPAPNEINLLNECQQLNVTECEPCIQLINCLFCFSTKQCLSLQDISSCPSFNQISAITCSLSVQSLFFAILLTIIAIISFCVCIPVFWCLCRNTKPSYRKEVNIRNIYRGEENKQHENDVRMNEIRKSYGIEEK